MKTYKQSRITLGVIIGISFALFAVGSKVIFGNPDTPRLLNYQGKLTDSDGPVTGTVSITFSIYDAGGTPIWSETHGNVTVTDGLFNAILGGTTPIPDSVFGSGERYLGLTVNGEEITQKQQIVSVIFALKAQDADTIDGKSASEFAPATHQHDASDITSGTLSEERLPQNAIDDSEIEDNSIISDDIKNDTISEDDIANTFKARDSDKLDGFDSSAFLSASTDYGRSGVASNLYEGTTKLSDKYLKSPVGTADIANNAITSAKIQDGQVTSTDIADDTITEADIVDSFKARDADKLDGKDSTAFLSTSNDYGRSGVASDLYEGTTKLSDKYLQSPVGTADIANNAITSAKIQDGQVTSADIADNTITEADIADSFKARDADKLDGYHYDSLPYAPQSGSSFYIQNQFVSSQSASFKIIGQGFIYSSDEPFFAHNTRTNAFGRIGFEGAGLVGVTDSPVFGGYSAIEAINQNATGVGVKALGQGLGGWHYAPQGAGVQANGKTYGLYASAEDDSGVTYGIYSRVDSPSGYAGYFDGDVLVNGDLSATGSKPATIRTSQGWERVYAIESPEVEISISGTDHLSEGESQVRFDRLFSEIISDKIPVRVIVTPVGSWSGIYVISANTEGFTVKSGAGNPNAAFNWIAIARRKGYEAKPNDNVWSKKVEEVIRETAENQTRVETQKKDILRIPRQATRNP